MNTVRNMVNKPIVILKATEVVHAEMYNQTPEGKKQETKK